MGAKVFGGPKYTVSPIYEGMFKEEMDAAAKSFPDVRYEPQLIDATYALLLARASEPLVIPALNRDGDCLSDLVLAFYGSIAGSESLLLSFDENFEPKVVMTEAPHGTAPSLQGKNIANPLAMILAGASLLTFLHTPAANRASRAIYEAAFEAIHDGIRTSDLGGGSTTTRVHGHGHPPRQEQGGSLGNAGGAVGPMNCLALQALDAVPDTGGHDRTRQSWLVVKHVSTRV